MPLREFTRQQQYLLPPSLDEWVPADHPIRYVAMFVDELRADDWAALGIDLAGAARGAPAYDPRLLISLWLAGFMQGIRSSRAVEAACRDQVSFRWLSGNQTPDHNTLARFWHAHRDGMRALLRCSVRTAVRSGLVDLAVVAVDGTKVAGNASTARTLDAAQLSQLLARTEQAIAELEAQSIVDERDADTARLPKELACAEALRAQVQAALATVQAKDGPARVNLTDPDATSQKSPGGYVTGYNAQAAAARVAMGNEQPDGLLLTAATVTTGTDHEQLLPMLEASTAALGCAPAVLAADRGYYSGENLVACAAREQAVAMPETRNARGPEDPYHRTAFAYDAAADTFTCPHGHTLHHIGLKHRPGRPPARRYGGIAAQCRACCAFGACTTSAQHGRTVTLHPHEAVVQAHREWMTTAPAQAAVARRKALIEPAFGIIKEVHRLPRFLLRGRANVTAEWTLLTVGFNLRTLARLWRDGRLTDGSGDPHADVAGHGLRSPVSNQSSRSIWRHLARSLPRVMRPPRQYASAF